MYDRDRPHRATMSVMRLRQRAHLRVASHVLDPGQVSQIIGVDPHETKLRGSRSPGPPPTPRVHLWLLKSGLPEDLRLYEHLDVLFAIIGAHVDGFRKVAMTPETAAWLTVVRYFEPKDDELNEAALGLPEGSPYERLSGQHPLLGWALDRERIALLFQSGIGLDIDEYG
jgi:uncharacterized protein DUF4279